MVTVGVISKAFDIPVSTIYYLVRQGKLPAHDATQPYHKQRRLKFFESEVRAALDAMRGEAGGR